MAISSIGLFLIAAICLRIMPSPSFALPDLDPNYPGPSVLAFGTASPTDVAPIPRLADLKRDLPSIYLNKCHQNIQGSEAIRCEFGDVESSRIAVLVGDSVAGQWLPALEKIAKEDGWKLISITKSGCAYISIPVRYKGKIYQSCIDWQKNALQSIKDIRPSIIFASQADSYGYVSQEEMNAAFLSRWDEYKKIGAKVFVIESTPKLSFDPAECLSENKNCQTALDKAYPKHRIQEIAKKRDVHYIDLNTSVCSSTSCDAIVGNVIAWRDKIHLSATFVRMMAPIIQTRIHM
ncbi:hypothetical protein FHS76_001033 [Ochrobactrum daejeonense]|uniref:SGNH domain-containing protein n=1 Tax=Brucella daejeonensis TaxID=659015 RepID=A0A7W9AV59_9HYPH|nr:SGNH hydrolase domain-containing protein [Brucella daejeonensis]MBB5701184.1 hypothetical protein [Brucella daejeonensis]